MYYAIDIRLISQSLRDYGIVTSVAKVYDLVN